MRCRTPSPRRCRRWGPHLRLPSPAAWCSSGRICVRLSGIGQGLVNAGQRKGHSVDPVHHRAGWPGSTYRSISWPTSSLAGDAETAGLAMADGVSIAAPLDGRIAAKPAVARRRSWTSRFGLVLFGVTVFVTLAGALSCAAVAARFHRHAVPAASRAAAWLGTDVLGRDVLSRILHGGTQILALSVLATLIGRLHGCAAGDRRRLSARHGR